MTKLLTLKEGAYYRRRDGVIVGPMRMRNANKYTAPRCDEVYNYFGKDPDFPDAADSAFDLVQEVYPRTPKPPRKGIGAFAIVDRERGEYMADEDTGRAHVYCSRKAANDAAREHYAPSYVRVVSVELPSPAPARKRVRK